MGTHWVHWAHWVYGYILFNDILSFILCVVVIASHLRHFQHRDHRLESNYDSINFICVCVWRVPRRMLSIWHMNQVYTKRTPFVFHRFGVLTRCRVHGQGVSFPFESRASNTGNVQWMYRTNNRALESMMITHSHWKKKLNKRKCWKKWKKGLSDKH